MTVSDQLGLPYQLIWPKARAGYVLEPKKEGGSTLLTSIELDRICPLPGPINTYEPMIEYPGLWRRFANQCLTSIDALAFVNEFGLLSNHLFDYPDQILNTAELIRQIIGHLDHDQRPAAADLFSKYAKPSLTACIITSAAGIFKEELVPTSLRGALLLQTLQTITGNRKWRRCRNEGCLEWFRLGSGGHTARREFCSDRCRVATARRKKETSHA